MTTFQHPHDLLAAAGTQLGTSRWIDIDQARIDGFAKDTEDHQWIHVDPERAKLGPFGTTIAHGYLTLSLAAPMLADILQVEQSQAAVNYGLNKVRFPAPVPVGSRVRGHVRLISAERRGTSSRRCSAHRRDRRHQQAGLHRRAGGAPLVTDRLRRVRLLGLDVRVAVRPGTAPGPPLLMCNGIGASLDLLQPFVDELDPRIGVVRFDVPGVGGSPTPPVLYTFPGLAWFVGKLMRHLGHDEYDVLGISWGGGLAQQVAFQHPRRCRRLVLVSTATGCLMVPAAPKVLVKLVTPRRNRDPDYAKSIAAHLYGGRLRDEPELARTLLHEHSWVGSPTGYLMQLLAGVGWTSLPALPLIRQQTLILAGTDDPIIPLVNARILRRLLPHATLHTYDDGHLGLVTQTDELAPVVSSFLCR